MEKIREEKFTCKRDALTIRGVQYMPETLEKDKKYPIAIVSHGFTGNYQGVADFGMELAKWGYIAFCFNFCGGGSLDPDETKSDGDTTEMTIWTEVEDLMAVKEYAKSLSFTDEEHIVLLGFSQGGFVSGLTAAKCKDEIEKLMMVFPAFCIPDHARLGCLGGASYDPQNVPERIDCGRSILSKRFHDEVVDMDPYKELKVYEGPVLIFHGMEDPVVDYTYSIRAKEQYGEKRCTLELIKGMGHFITEEQKESMLISMQYFLK